MFDWNEPRIDTNNQEFSYNPLNSAEEIEADSDWVVIRYSSDLPESEKVKIHEKLADKSGIYYTYEGG